MSASKNKVTATHLSSESKARKLFLRLYALFSILLVSLIGYFYFSSQEQLMFSEQRIRMMEYATMQARKLKQLHRHYPKDIKYPRDSRYKSAIYDLEYQKIFSTLNENSVNLEKVIYNIGDSMHLVKMLDDYYLGAKYLVIEISKDKSWYLGAISAISAYSLFALTLVMLLGLYLAKLFVRPMRNSIMLLDRFIKDTTHELNTPLSAILANIEMIDRTNMNEGNAKKLNRIEIGARTVSTLYEDLKFLTLEQNRELINERFDLAPLLENRLEYFALQMKSKNISLVKNLSESFMIADKRLIRRVIDNLLSNAIKYNRRGGSILIALDDSILVVEDSGIGIEKDKLDTVFDRYSRFNKSEGGFGIGLNIVKSIVDYYGMKIEIKSEIDAGTQVFLKWKETDNV